MKAWSCVPPTVWKYLKGFEWLLQKDGVYCGIYLRVNTFCGWFYIYWRVLYVLVGIPLITVFIIFTLFDLLRVKLSTYSCHFFSGYAYKQIKNLSFLILIAFYLYRFVLIICKLTSFQSAQSSFSVCYPVIVSFRNCL